MKPVIIIPAYNPDEKLTKLVEDIEHSCHKVVVINDGSNENSALVFNSLNCYSDFCDVCVHESNQGKGSAIKTGIKYA